MEILNRKARYDYVIEDTYEAGIVLTGTEIKSVRQGRLILKIVMLLLEMMKYIYLIHIFLFMKKVIDLIMKKIELESYYFIKEKY